MQTSKTEPEERITQLEWEIDKMHDIKNVEGVGKEELVKLRAPTEPSEIDWRIQSSGGSGNSIWAQIIPYIDARAVIDRLDRCVGPHRWQDAYEEIEGGYLCTLLIYTRNGWISKQDASDKSDIEAIKGGVSGALKRAAVKWGIGRDLYHLGTHWAEISLKELPHFKYAKTKNGEVFYWKPKT